MTWVRWPSSSGWSTWAVGSSPLTAWVGSLSAFDEVPGRSTVVLSPSRPGPPEFAGPVTGAGWPPAAGCPGGGPKAEPGGVPNGEPACEPPYGDGGSDGAPPYGELDGVPPAGAPDGVSPYGEADGVPPAGAFGVPPAGEE